MNEKSKSTFKYRGKYSTLHLQPRPAPVIHSRGVDDVIPRNRDQAPQPHPHPILPTSPEFPKEREPPRMTQLDTHQNTANDMIVYNARDCDISLLDRQMAPQILPDLNDMKSVPSTMEQEKEEETPSDLRYQLEKNCVEMEVAIKHLGEQLQGKLSKLNELYYDEFYQQEKESRPENTLDNDLVEQAIDDEIIHPQQTKNDSVDETLLSIEKAIQELDQIPRRLQTVKPSTVLDKINSDIDFDLISLQNHSISNAPKPQSQFRIPTSPESPKRSLLLPEFKPIDLSPAVSDTSVTTNSHGYLLYSSQFSPSTTFTASTRKRSGENILDKYRKMICAIDKDLWDS